MKTNSTIFKNPEEDHLIDLSYIGTMLREKIYIDVTQEGHYFIPGDVLAYNLKDKKFIKAIAVNTMDSEVCGVVLESIDMNHFTLTTQGTVYAPQYNYPNDSTLWLSEVIPGKLMSIAPTSTFRKVAKQISPGIIEVSLEIGLTTGAYVTDTLEYYTQQELDEIILNVI